MSKLPFERLSEIEDQGIFETLATDLEGFNQNKYLRAGSGDLVVLGGRPGSGKTALALQIAHQISLNRPVLFFSLEMDKRQLRARLKKGKADAAKAELYICDQAGLTADEITDTINACIENDTVGLVVIDYAQIVQAYGRTKAEEVGSTVRRLKETAKDTGVPILVLAQMSRDIEKRAANNEFAEPVMSDLADSAELEKWADSVLLLHRMGKQKQVYKIFCVKNRHGDAVHMELVLDKDTLRFQDLSSVVNIYQF